MVTANGLMNCEPGLLGTKARSSKSKDLNSKLVEKMYKKYLRKEDRENRVDLEIFDIELLFNKYVTY